MEQENKNEKLQANKQTLDNTKEESLFDNSEKEIIQEVVGTELTDEDEAGDVQENKAIAYLSYINLLCLIPLFGNKQSEFAQFHSKRGLILVFIWYIGYITLKFGIGFFICLGVVVLSVMGLIQVSEGKKGGLPMVDEIVEKLNL